VKKPGETNSKPNPIPAGRITALAKRAGRLAEKQRKTGYH
jgi:hypothetical protein